MPLVSSNGLAIAATGLTGCVIVTLVALALYVSGHEHAVEPLIYYVALPLCVVGWLALFTLPSRGK